MFQLSLNIGLSLPASTFLFNADLSLPVSAFLLSVQDIRLHVIRAFPSANGGGAVFELAQSATEPTLVCSLFFAESMEVADIDAVLHSLSAGLDQDCIAWSYGAHSALSGPKAEDWGDFDPDLFIRPSVVLTVKGNSHV